ncbi:hypothetical protein DFH11DRAFT_983710 [Phellopilus nigrolimitatus]|nr:hypothetical protein DFH11DRAFT_983710 [Phellopilus nigrolimitatus]
MDLKHIHGTNVLAVRACYHEDGADLLAVAGEDSVQILQCNHHAIKSLAFFTVGLKVTAIAWSSRAVSPAVSDEWCIELAISTHDFSLHILSKTSNSEEKITSFGGGLTGHHGRINDITFVGGQDNSARHIASVSDDMNLIVWDLCPAVNPAVNSVVEHEANEQFDSNISSHPIVRQPTALVIPFSYPLCSVSSHATTSKELLVSDTRGSVFLIDWRKDPNDIDEDILSQQNVIELVHPRILADAISNLPKYLSGCASWQRDDANVIGSVFGTEFALWDLSKLKGGKPLSTGLSFPEGGHRFRWCPTFPEYFAISTASATSKGAVVNIYSSFHLQTQATTFQISPRPHRLTDFDWMATRGTPRLAAAVGRVVYIFPISVN